MNPNYSPEIEADLAAYERPHRTIFADQLAARLSAIRLTLRLSFLLMTAALRGAL